jgi:two-component system response regulator PilR (NtrC family)
MKHPLTLIVDDEPDICELLEITLNRMNIDTRRAETMSSSLSLLKQYPFDLCLTDMRLPDGNGLDLLAHLQQHHPSIPVIVISAYGNMDIAIKAMKKGAFDFIAKPIDLSTLRHIIQGALTFSDIHQNIADALPAVTDALIGSSPIISQIRLQIEKLSRSQAPVYISGESGVGKELVAKLIHQSSYRRNKPFIGVNCGAIPYELMESEFFGYKKGSFTGATSDKQGLFQAAEGGTLFLDEIADLPATLQVKLLRAVQEKKVRAIGDSQETSVDVRLLSATHKDLGMMVKNGEFRQDLYYRINVIELNVPPLRARAGDIPQLAQHLLANLAQANHLPMPVLSDNAIQALKQYSFPGNVRELENILERALTICDHAILEAKDFIFPNHPHFAASSLTHEYCESGVSLENYLNEIEKQAICSVLEKHQWNLAATARQLGVSFRSLRYRLKKLGL